MIENIEDLKNILRGKKVLISMFIGELGWFLQYYQAFLRFLKLNDYKDYDFVLMCNSHLHIFVDDFIAYTFDPPEWFRNLGLDTDCYEAVEPNSPAGSLTPPNVYQNLVFYLEDVCEYAEAKEILLPPRGPNFVINGRPQMFHKYNTGIKMHKDFPIITVFPRARSRAAIRNVPEYVWYETVMKLTEFFIVVLAGTPSGACLGDLKGRNIINLINYNECDKTEKIIGYLNNSICSVSSQSGGTHISLLSYTPSYIIGHEQTRHATELNRLNTPTSFRVVSDYRAIDSITIMNDIRAFLNALEKESWFSKIERPSLKTLQGKKDLIGVEIGVGFGLNALNMLQNLDIKKLYLIDPYTLNDDIKAIGGVNAEKAKMSAEAFKSKAIEVLKDYKHKIEWIYDFSENAIDKIKDMLDFVYIDGDHNYEFVKKDIELYQAKVKDGGLVAGHDFDNKQVEKAVYDYYDKSLVNFSDSDWWIVKPAKFDSILSQDYNKLMELCT